GLSSARAKPGASAVVPTAQADVRLIADSATVGSSDSIRLGLWFTLKPHWKVYWRSPGDAGYPPAVTWREADNLAAAEILWPAPRRFSIQSIETVGYEDEVVLPILVTLKTPGRPLSLKAAVDFLICKEICVPQHVDLALALGSGPQAPTAFTPLLERYAANVPGKDDQRGLHLNSATTDGVAQPPVLEVVATADIPFQSPDLFVESPAGYGFGAPEVRLEDGGLRAVLRLPATTVPEKPLSDTTVTVTLVDGSRAAETELTVRTAAATTPQGGGTLVSMLVIALVGGFVLNLMPCVLPVLSLKFLGVVGLGGAQRRQVRAGFLASAAGILASFLALAVLAIALKAGGQAVGWGIQFQHPLFLATMIFILLLFAANLVGLFEISLPHWLSDLLGAGDAHSLSGHFLSGAFATLLATPCSAPFLGTAIGFALARGPGEIVAIFTTLGLGMASPYLLVAAAPGLARWLPEPGRWMASLRLVLGAALVGTAVWLGSILLVQMGATSIPETQHQAWRPFDPATLRREVEAGHVVLVDVTARWCVTCQVNKLAVLGRGEVAKRIEKGSVIALRADWTRPDDTIAAYLAGFGRYGIPFNAVYGPGLPAGLALPELLTEAEVVSALDRAAR
ncbi:MAG: protein-disulfide reductase DsbD family protein, partial [Alphaproteobacteria bacterium]